MIVSAQKEIKTYKNIDIHIDGIRLLTKKEYDFIKDKYEIKNVYKNESYKQYWLQTPYPKSTNFVYTVWYDREAFNITATPTDDKIGVRPVLDYSYTSNLIQDEIDIGDKIILFGYTWTILSYSSILCDEIVGITYFRKDASLDNSNIYEESDIRKWLENWLSIKITGKSSNTNTNGWIPINEKLPDPEKRGIYLVTLNNYETDFCEWNGEEFDWRNPKLWYHNDEVTAWMPLPEPMKVGE